MDSVALIRGGMAPAITFRMKKDWNGQLADTNAEIQDSLDRSESQILASYGMIGSILGFAFLGYVLDRWTGDAPTFLVSGVTAGMAIGFYSLIRTVRKAER